LNEVLLIEASSSVRSNFIFWCATFGCVSLIIVDDELLKFDSLITKLMFVQYRLVFLFDVWAQQVSDFEKLEENDSSTD
jgi:hypothetical protein